MADEPAATTEPAAAPAPALPVMLSGERVRLVLVTPDDAADMLAGRHQERWHADYPRRDDVDAATLVRRGDPVAATWGPRHVVADYLAVGSLGCFGPPVPHDDGVLETEVGYGLVPAARGRGLATEALRALLAETDRLGVRLRAATEPGNTASLRVLARCGFTSLRGSDEEGMLVMARPLPAATGATGA